MVILLGRPMRQKHTYACGVTPEQKGREYLHAHPLVCSIWTHQLNEVDTRFGSGCWVVSYDVRSGCSTLLSLA